MAEVSVKANGQEYGFRNQIENVGGTQKPMFSGLGGPGNYTFRNGGNIIDALNENPTAVNRSVLRILGQLNRAYHTNDKEEFDELLVDAFNQAPSSIDPALDTYKATF